MKFFKINEILKSSKRKKTYSLFLVIFIVFVVFSFVTFVQGTTLSAIFSSLINGFYNQTDGVDFGLRNNAPILFMDFDTAPTGTYVQDNSIYNNFGTTSGTPTYTESCTSGSGGNCFTFDGVDDLINIGNPDSLKINSGTISAWFKTTDTGNNYNGLITKVSAYALYIKAGKVIWYDWGGTGINTGSIAVADGNWHHIVFSFQSGVINGTNIYVDSVLDKQAKVTIANQTSVLYIGGDPTNTNFVGSIDQVQIWDRVLSATEVSELYNGSVGGYSNSAYIGKYSRLGDFKSFVFHNATSTYWSTLLDFAGSVGNDTTYDLCIADTNCVSYWALDGNYQDSKRYVVHTFTSSDDFIVTSGTGSIDVLVVAGGGGGGGGGGGWLSSSAGAGGAGAGGVIHDSAYSIATGTYSVTIGAGGTGGIRSDYGTKGGNSSFDTIYVAEGGGFGAKAQSSGNYNGGNGGSGGGAARLGTYGTGVSGQGYRGGLAGTATPARGGGGGGAGAVGQNGSNWTGAGGAGISFLGNTYAVGGNGCGTYDAVASNEASNTGNGGDAGMNSLAAKAGGNGGSGIVIIKYLEGTLEATGGTITYIAGNDGTPTGTNNATGISSGAMYFDGVDDYVNIGTTPSSLKNANESLSFWLNPNSVVSGSIYSLGGSHYHYDIYYGRLELDYRNSTNSNKVLRTDNVFFTKDEWHFYNIIRTVDEANLVIQSYKDGELFETTTQTEGWYSTYSSNVYLGSYNGVSSFFNGTIDEVLIYNKSLTGSEVTELYKAGLSQHADTNVSLQTRTATSYNLTDVGLVSQWDFNDGTANDAMGRYNGTIVNALTNEESGIVGYGGYFDGTGDYITLSGFASATTSHTVSTWLKSSKADQDRDLVFDLNGDIFIAWFTSTSGQIGWYDGTWRNIGSAPNDGEWHHVTWVFNGATSLGYIYIDGVLFGSTTYTPKTIGTNCVMGIARGLNAGYEFEGTIDEVRIYDRALSAAEVLDIYELGTSYISWGDWQDEGVMEDGVATTSTADGKFFQFKAILETDDTNISPYVSDYTVSATSSSLAATAEITVVKTGTQIATTTMPVIGLDLGGAFLLTSTSGDADISSIKIKQVGSLATTSFSDITLSYQDAVDETCSITTPVDADSFGTADSFDENNIATTTGSLTLSDGVPVCLYLNYTLADEYSSASLGRSIDFEITNPSLDIVIEGGTVITTGIINISGRTMVMTNDILSLLSLHMSDTTKDPTIFYLQNDAVWKKEGVNDPIRLTNSNLKVHSLIFTDMTGANSGGSVRMQITVSNMDPGNEGIFLNVTRTLSTSATVRAWSGND